MANDKAVAPPWRQPAPKQRSNYYEKLGMRATNEPGSKTALMYAPAKGAGVGMDDHNHNGSGGFLDDFDPELRLAFSRNFKFLQRVFSFDTLVKPLPPQLGQSVARNLGFFTRIFTQFFDPRGIENARKTMGLGEEQVMRKIK